jgi:very-short-patch-repair endonuclease
MKRLPPDGAIKRARRLRREMTDARRHVAHSSQAFPNVISGGRCRSHFIADFACHAAKLIIEVDEPAYG